LAFAGFACFIVGCGGGDDSPGSDGAVRDGATDSDAAPHPDSGPRPDGGGPSGPLRGQVEVVERLGPHGQFGHVHGGFLATPTEYMHFVFYANIAVVHHHQETMRSGDCPLSRLTRYRRTAEEVAGAEVAFIVASEIQFYVLHD
jgi:hypothetical protein